MVSNNNIMNKMITPLRSRLVIVAVLTAITTCPKNTSSDGDIINNHNNLLLLLLLDLHLNIFCFDCAA